MSDTTHAAITLFDVNARWGTSAAQAVGFEKISSLLAHMDRLGIERSLVWNVASREDHVPLCNRQLQDAIDETPGAIGRVLPMYTISPIMLYDRGAVEELASMMKHHHVRALRFTSGLIGLRLPEIEPIVGVLRPLRPAIVMACGENNAADILEFTAHYPDVPVVITEFGWNQTAHVYDLMRRRPNVLMDISMLHTWEGIELSIHHFGPDRIIFGTGVPAQNGAAIAELMRARISDCDRRKIAHGNLDRIAFAGGPAPTRRVTVADGLAGKKLWHRFITGQQLGVDAIDAHGHLGGSGGYVVGEHSLTGQVPQAIQAMKDIGLSMSIWSGLHALLGSDCVAGNDELERAVGHHVPSGMHGYVSFHPQHATCLLERLDDWFSRPFFVGFKILCDYWRIRVDNPCFDPMWQYADQHCLPVLIHTWDGPYNSPRMLDEIAARYPNASLLLAHSGGGDGGRREAEMVAQKHANIYLEFCGSFHCSIPWESTLAVVGGDRVVFGSDAVMHSVVWELGRLLSVNVSDDTLAAILGSNMRRILARRR